MSLLDRKAPHTVLVQKRVPHTEINGIDVYENDGDPIPVRCAVQLARDWSSAEEKYTGGLQILDMRVIYSRTWPGDAHSHVIWEGEIYEMVGDPGQTSMSSRTTHWRITCRRIGTA